jgi:7,8-dihydroneopterin aldolase/epimerase/oxygenase
MGAERDEDPDELTGVDGPGVPNGADGGADTDSDSDHDERAYVEEPQEPAQEAGEVFELEEDDDEDIDLDEDREETGESVTIEIAGLSLYTHHGVSEAEREVGQRLMLDLRLDLGETDATVTDSIEDTVDYGEVCQLVALIAQQRSHNTLERLCSTIADRLLGDYELEGVWVKATKPEPPIALPVEEVSVEVWREAEE